MMDKHFNDTEKWLKFDIPVHTDKWHEFRTIGVDEWDGGVGASECGKLIHNMDQYPPTPPELYRHKIGMERPEFKMNEAIFHGIFSESTILNYWQFEDGQKSYMERFSQYSIKKDERLKFRTASKPSYYLVNKRIPWLFASLDSVVPKGSLIIGQGEETFDGETALTDFPLECKNVSEWVFKKYNGPEPKYICQVHQQMLVTESVYSEIVMLVAGRELHLFPVHYDDNLASIILETSYRFWQKVLKGREHWKEFQILTIQNKPLAAEREMQQIMNIEPEVANNSAGENYLKNEYMKKAGIVQRNSLVVNGDVELYSSAKNYYKLGKAIKVLEEKRIEEKVKLLKHFNNSGAKFVKFTKNKKINLATDGKLHLSGFSNYTDENAKRLLNGIVL